MHSARLSNSRTATSVPGPNTDRRQRVESCSRTRRTDCAPRMNSHRDSGIPVIVRLRRARQLDSRRKLRLGLCTRRRWQGYVCTVDGLPEESLAHQLLKQRLACTRIDLPKTARLGERESQAGHLGVLASNTRHERFKRRHTAPRFPRPYRRQHEARALAARVPLGTSPASLGRGRRRDPHRVDRRERAMSSWVGSIARFSSAFGMSPIALGAVAGVPTTAVSGS